MLFITQLLCKLERTISLVNIFYFHYIKVIIISCLYYEIFVQNQLYCFWVAWFWEKYLVLTIIRFLYNKYLLFLCLIQLSNEVFHSFVLNIMNVNISKLEIQVDLLSLTNSTPLKSSSRLMGHSLPHIYSILGQ